jgi:hypothetical protein
MATTTRRREPGRTAVPGGQIVSLLAKAGPVAAKQVPKLWPLLLESRNRERLAELAQGLADSSPTRRLRARLTLTAALADDIAGEARTDADRARAAGWATRARNLHHKMDLPVAGRTAKAVHRRAIRTDLDALHREMTAHLDTGPSAGRPTRF